MFTLKNLIVSLGIAALTSGSAFAATKAPKAKTPVTHTHKVAQAGEAKPAEGKAKTEKTSKADKKMKAEKKVDKKEAKPAETAPAPAHEKK
jgi:hypothetical protein